MKDWLEYAILAFAVWGLLDVLSGLVGRFWSRARVGSVVSRVFWMPKQLRRATLIKLIELERARANGNVALLVTADDQVAYIEDLPDYERAVQALEWMRLKSDSTVVPGGPAYHGPWRAEYFTAYTGAAGDYLDGRRVGDGVS